jgi:hypothetical protein
VKKQITKMIKLQLHLQYKEIIAYNFNSLNFISNLIMKNMITCNIFQGLFLFTKPFPKKFLNNNLNNHS